MSMQRLWVAECAYLHDRHRLDTMLGSSQSYVAIYGASTRRSAIGILMSHGWDVKVKGSRVVVICADCAKAARP